MTSASDPIGVFDSGIGGLTVLRAILQTSPGERLLYVADQLHVPYGGRPLPEVCAFASAISRFLVGSGCRAVVMGCNISSAVALDAVSRDLAPLPVVGMIEPAVQALVSHGDLRIGVLATEGTVRSGAYRNAILRRIPNAQVTQVPCPRFVPLVEGGAQDSPEAADAASEYLAPLAAAGATAVVLGCTHYPFLLPTLRRAADDLFGPSVEFIDPSGETALAVARALPRPSTGGGEPCHLLLTSGNVDAFREQAARCLPGARYRVAGACWSPDNRVLTSSATTCATPPGDRNP